jgi:hypothetical protein
MSARADILKLIVDGGDLISPFFMGFALVLPVWVAKIVAPSWLGLFPTRSIAGGSALHHGFQETRQRAYNLSGLSRTATNSA